MPTVKLVVIGPSGVGKTSFRGQYISGRFSTGYRATIGADFISKTLPNPENPSDPILLQIWDTAGQERFSSLSAAFFRGADAVMLMFDVNRPQTMHALTKWWDEFRDRAPVEDADIETFCCIIVGNKIDVGDGVGRVGEIEARDFADSLIPPSAVPSPTLLSATPEVPENDYTGGLLSVNGIGQNGHVAAQSLDIKQKRRISKSRSRSASRFSTMTTTHSFHTASSSLIDVYVSAQSSPAGSYSSAGSGSYKTRRRRQGSESSTESGITITPSLFNAQISSTVATTPPTPPQEPSRPPSPIKRPALFFTSAKTGEGVSDVFEYTAQRVMRQWAWEQSVENRILYMHDGSNASQVMLGSHNGSKSSLRESCCS